MTMGPAPMIMIDVISVLFGMSAPHPAQNFAGYSQALCGRKTERRGDEKKNGRG